MDTKYLFLFVFILTFFTSNLQAQPRSEVDAMQIAYSHFLEAQGSSMPQISLVSQQSLRKQIVRKIKGNAKQTGCYIVNDNANSRFVIVSADERMAEILGYSDNGTFDTTTAPPALLAIIDDYNRQYNLLVSGAINVKRKRERKKVEAIPYFIKTKWDQDEPFNNECPLDENGNRCVTGCVATAMAQVMNYYQYPHTESKGFVSYEGGNDFFSPKISQSFNYDDLVINWDNIVNDYSANVTAEQKEEVAKLMHACGVAVYMSYGNQSSADDSDIPHAMINNFGYNPNMFFASKDYYTLAEWNTVIQEELNAHRPILYASNAHEYILDGMDASGLYHFNFGWSGSGDGFYDLDAITPVGTTLASGQTMVVGICPREVGVHQDIFYYDDFQLEDGAAVGSKSKIKSLPVWCFSNEANTNRGKELFHGEYGVGVYDRDFNFVKSIYSTEIITSNRNMQSSSGTRVAVYFDSETFKEGSEYLLIPYAKCNNSTEPTKMRHKGGKSLWYKATVKNGWVTLERGGEITPIDQLLGDSNGDGIIDVGDIVSIINYILERPSSDFVLNNSDMNHDGEVDIADIPLVISEIMKQ